MAFINELYYQRNLVALTLANAFEGSGWYYDEKSKNKKTKRVIKINHPEGQMCFHIPDDFDLGNLPQIDDDWDGHTTKEKWERMKKACGIG
ncbi:hypothetical protein OEJ84_23750 (plasmid) [Bacillus subtilis]|uniref:Uncharacterized protein n=2 Tax=root TaxID=1 RepID=A0AC61TTH6_9CAUD|nr:hypothetical protein [Bacillus subtilis]YP_010681801.1 hypothetical protein PQE76_gp183 [Bacillus phage vB_BsuS_PJN02]UNH58526.1 hypothetical protein [Bacillus phage vB_BsuS_PJN02]WOF32916.1 hypothetical protein OEJ84_23750 [Bacillus subtilis]